MQDLENLINDLRSTFNHINDLCCDVEYLAVKDLANNLVQDSIGHFYCALDDLENIIYFLEQIDHVCPSCGYYLTPEDNLYCDSCGGSDENIYYYHDYTITNKNANSPLTFGIELETSNINAPCALSNGWICAEDSSISGLEFISPVYGFNQIQEFKRDIKELCNNLSYMNADTHKDISTGLHIHINSDAFRCSNKDLWGFVLKYKHEFMAVGGRFATSEAFSYCEPKNNLCSDGNSVFDRYGLLNINEKYNTIEFRLFNATLNFNTVFLRVEFVRYLAYYSPNINSDTTFQDFLNFLYASNEDLYKFVIYWIDRRLYDIKELF